MKCPNDQTEMEEGSLHQIGLGPVVGWVPNKKVVWKPKKITTFRCPNCGKLESFTEPNK